MNKAKNQNSILVLATLGVYLGLVLAGATPQVLAQAADSVRKKADSDNVDRLLEKVEASFSTLLTGLKACKKLPVTFSKSDDRWVEDCGFSVAVGKHAVRGPRPNEFARFALSLLDGFDSNLFDGLSKDGSDPYRAFDFYGRGLRLTLVLDQDSGDRADVLAELLDGHIKSKAFRASTYLQENLYKDSLAYVVGGNQVIVVTRLPRGSLDLLLASNAK